MSEFYRITTNDGYADLDLDEVVGTKWSATERCLEVVLRCGVVTVFCPPDEAGALGAALHGPEPTTEWGPLQEWIPIQEDGSFKYDEDRNEWAWVDAE